MVVDQVSPRLTYVLKWTLRDRLGIDFQTRESDSESAKAIENRLQEQNPLGQSFDGVLYYGERPAFNGAVSLKAEGLLHEKGIQPYTEKDPGRPWVGCLRRMDDQGNSFLAMFPTEHELGHDPLAGIFWMLSRYEEYQRPERDILGRFPVTASWLAREGVLEIPLADYYAEQLGHWLSKNFADYTVPNPARVVQPTVDVDLCYSYLGKPFLRQVGGWLKDILQGCWQDVVLRIRVLMGLAYDPYDSYAALQDLHRRWEAASALCKKPLYFFLMADYGGLDQGHSPQSRYLHRVIRFLQDTGAEIGWHPSLRSNTDEAFAIQEKTALEALVGKVSASRQHYLALNLPERAERLEAMGLRFEYSMGFAERPGFKAGTLHPFGFYDLAREQELPLLMFPVAVMDATLRHHLSLNPEQAWERVQPVLKAWERYGGFFTLLWHNSTVDSGPSASKDQDHWRVFYQKCYEKVLDLANPSALISIPSHGSLIEGHSCEQEGITEGRWTVRALTAAERKGWDAALPPAVSVYHRITYLNHCLGRQWSLLLSPNQRWAMPIPGGLAAWIKVLRQPLMVQHYQVLRVEFWEGQIRPSPEVSLANEHIYASLLKFLDRSYAWVDWQLDCPERPGSLVELLPGPRWTWVARPSYVIDVGTSSNEKWRNYSDHHRRYLRYPLADQGRQRLGWEFLPFSTWDQAVSQTGLEQTLESGLHSKLGWNRLKIHKAKLLICNMLSENKGTLFLLRKSETCFAAAVLWHSGNTLIYQFAWDSPQGRSERATMHLVHSILEWARAQSNPEGQPTFRFLDMEGSEISGLQRFYAGFGGEPRLYWRIIKRIV